MIRFEIEQEIQRLVSEVFAYITDVANLPQCGTRARSGSSSPAALLARRTG